jgi:acyl-CoA synthetase (NDP forming)
MPQLDSSVAERFSPLFEPRVIAVVGASTSKMTPGNEFIRHSRALGFKGKIVVLHPSAHAVDGEEAVTSFAACDEMIDFAYIAIDAARVPDLLLSANGRVKFALVMSSGFGEIESGRDLEAKAVNAAAAAGVRLLGPNCLGVYAPRAGLAFVGGCSQEAGPVGVISQSGGLGVDILLRGKQRGLRYSGLVTIGNSADVGPDDLLEFFLADPHTSTIGLYLEDVKRGRRFLEILRASRASKPIVLLLGGQTSEGRSAATSHTGAMASDLRIWLGIAKQTGLIIAETLEEFLDTLLAFQVLLPRPQRPTQNVVMFGNGGGTSVLGADALARRKLNVPRLTAEAIQALEALHLPPGSSVINPIDAPAGTLRKDEGRVAEAILEVVYRLVGTDAIVMHLNLAVFAGAVDQKVDFVSNLVNSAVAARAGYQNGPHLVLVLRSDGSEQCDRRRRELREALVPIGIPIFDELTNAATALGNLAVFEKFVASRREVAPLF